MIKTFAERNDLLPDITVGIIERTGNLSEDDYYKIFRVDIDPYFFIIDTNGEITFMERPEDQDEINVNYVNNRLALAAKLVK